MALEAGKISARDFCLRSQLTLSQAVNFLNKMARDVDFSQIDAPDMEKSVPHGGLQSPFNFTPMRRKHHIPGRG